MIYNNNIQAQHNLPNYERLQTTDTRRDPGAREQCLLGRGLDESIGGPGLPAL